MNALQRENMARVTRRQLFGSAASGVGMAALASLMGAGSARGAGTDGPIGQRGLPGLPHFAPRAKRVVVLWQGGGPSHVDLFDPKPVMNAMAGKNIPDSVRGMTRLSTMSSGYGKWPTLPAIKPFKKYGQSGIEMSAMLPSVGGLADEICLVRSMYTEAVNHAPGVTFFMTGSQVPGRPSMGAWLSYGLGSETDNLPTFVVMTSSDKGKTCGQLFFDYYWGSGFLPSRFQAVRFRNTGDLVPYLANPPGVSREARRALLDEISAINAAHLADYGDPEIDTRISQYEMAFRMQTSVPDLVDFSNESKITLARYGPDALQHGTFANNCLIARRLLERGVRFVQLMHSGWDQHSNLFTQLEAAVQGHGRSIGGLGARPQRARDARRHARRLGWRIRTHAVWSGQSGKAHGSRPLWQGLQLVARGGRRQIRHGLWIDRRIRLEHRIQPGPRTRYAGDDLAPLWNRPHETDVPVSRPPIPSDRRARESRHRAAGMILRRHRIKQNCAL